MFVVIDFDFLMNLSKSVNLTMILKGSISKW